MRTRPFDPSGRHLIEQVIDGIVAGLAPSSGDELAGFLTDAEHFFSSHASFAAATVQAGPDPSCLVRAALTVANDVETIQDLSTALHRVWLSLLYRHFEASSVAWYREAACLRFVTVIGDGSFHVTGAAYARGPRYPLLVAAFEERFGDVHGPLLPIPGGLPPWAL